MTDSELIDLYLQRSEEAIVATKRVYGSYCNAIASRIVGNIEDTEECVSDVLLRVWNAIPPEIPRNFKGWIGCITRNCAITMCRKREKEPERIGEAALELSFALDGNPEQIVDAKILGRAISEFLSAQKKEIRIAFLRRYWYGDGIGEIAQNLRMTPHTASVRLFRLRQRLQKYLQKEGLIA